ncbi:hypothetical protein [Faecalicoccus pleomorphus]|uniref:hypothetical protein n=1 Tax=Faecalicoccus pleomorphus TaxID=1323 RepID=UPI00294349EA|nr:hypothetical protein [Faecalicoccus pleomorphus]
MTDQEIVDCLEEEGIERTENSEEAIYILRNGQMISGMYYDGSTRTEDHLCIELCFDTIDRYTDGFWGIVHEQLGVVRVVPETQKLLIMENQELTPEQEEQMKQNFDSYSIEEYVHQPEHDYERC